MKLRIDNPSFTFKDAQGRAVTRWDSDPMTESTDWGLVEAPGGGFMGVYSRSEETPIKTGNFAAAEQAFEAAEHYTKWMFTYSPSGPAQNVAPAKPR